jgi:hypothetical protein
MDSAEKDLPVRISLIQFLMSSELAMLYALGCKGPKIPVLNHRCWQGSFRDFHFFSFFVLPSNQTLKDKYLLFVL